MGETLKSIAWVGHAVLQRLALAALVLTALGLAAATALAALGHWPWLELQAGYGGRTIEAGWIVQTGVTGFAALLCVYLPANWRIMQLETSHRRFTIGMQDVARAYALAHAGDRAGLFQLSSEFDSVRERLAFLRAHPDLEGLEPDLLEVAAQMSHISRELAETYSDEKVARARAFLTERQQEVDTFNARLEQAKRISRELKHWTQQVELEEAVAASQLQRLSEELHEVLPELGREQVIQSDGTVVDIPPRAAE